MSARKQIEISENANQSARELLREVMRLVEETDVTFEGKTPLENRLGEEPETP